MKNISKTMLLIFGLTVLAFSLMPDFAWADDPNVFDTIEGKLYQTLKDVREIVYVVAGFGLIMFAVLAIFNKISFKHLGYIMIGLSLLALLFPFLEYFSGSDSAALREQVQMTYDTYFNPEMSSGVQGTGDDEIKDPDYNGEKPGDTGDPYIDEIDTGEDDEELQRELDAEEEELRELREQQEMDEYLAKEQDRLNQNLEHKKEAYEEAGCDLSTGKGSWDTKKLTRNVCSFNPDTGEVTVTRQVCEGGRINDKGECGRTVLTTIRDISKGAQAGAKAVTQGIAAVGSGVNTVVSIGTGAAGVANAISNSQWTGDNFLDTLGNIGGSVSNIVGAAATGINNTATQASATIGNAGNAINAASEASQYANRDYENNPSGSNSFADAWNNKDADGNYTSGLRNALNNANSTIHNTNNDIQAGAGYTQSTINAGNSAINSVEGISDRVNNTTGEVNKAIDQLDTFFGGTRVADREAAEAQARADEEAAKQEKIEAERKAAEEEREAARKAREEETALNNLTLDQIDMAVDSGLLTQEQADALKAAQEETAQKEADDKAQKCAEKAKSAAEAASAASARVAEAQKALSEAKDPGAIAAALAALQAAQRAETQAKTNAKAAADACK